jgi:hypothetical protein
VGAAGPHNRLWDLFIQRPNLAPGFEAGLCTFNIRYKFATGPGVLQPHCSTMSITPTLAEWIETATTTLAVRPELRDNLREELEQWLAEAFALQVCGGHRSGADAIY